MHTRRMGRWLAAIAAVTLLFGACGDSDDDEGASGTGTESESGSGDSGENVLRVEMKDFAYGVEGELKEGPFRLETENTGEEFHMIAVAKLKEGVEIADVAKGLQSLGGPPGGEQGGGEDGSEDDSNQSTTTAGRNTTTTRASRAQSATTTTTARSGASTTSTTAGEEAQSGQAEGEGGGGDPFAEFFEEEEIGAPGHVLTPGAEQSVTMEEGFEPGSYAMICFIPGEGDGTPHFAKGMIGTFEVEEGEGELDLPEPDATYTLGDSEKPDGPTELQAGEVTVEVKAEGQNGHDFFIGAMKEGKDFSDFDTFFEETFEGENPPPKGAAADAPGTFAGSVFEVKPGSSLFLTVQLKKGELVVVNTTNSESEEEGEEPDEQILEVTVK